MGNLDTSGLLFFCGNFSKVADFVGNSEKDECASVNKLKKLPSEDDVQQQLAFITSRFKPLCTAITKLEGRDGLTESLVFEEIIDTFAIGFLDKYITKLQDVI